MVSKSCILFVKEQLRKLNVLYIFVELGKIEIMSISEKKLKHLKTILSNSGLNIIETEHSILLEKLKSLIIEIVQTDKILNINISDYLAETLNCDYVKLSLLFSDVHGSTIEKYIINQKVEKIKELLLYKELNISQIAQMMHYSSISHLSHQFKNVVGLTPTQFKHGKNIRIPIEDL